MIRIISFKNCNNSETTSTLTVTQWIKCVKLSRNQTYSAPLHQKENELVERLIQTVKTSLGIMMYNKTKDH